MHAWNCIEKMKKRHLLNGSPGQLDTCLAHPAKACKKMQKHILEQSHVVLQCSANAGFQQQK